MLFGVPPMVLFIGSDSLGSADLDARITKDGLCETFRQVYFAPNQHAESRLTFITTEGVPVFYTTLCAFAYRNGWLLVKEIKSGTLHWFRWQGRHFQHEYAAPEQSQFLIRIINQAMQTFSQQVEPVRPPPDWPMVPMTQHTPRGGGNSQTIIIVAICAITFILVVTLAGLVFIRHDTIEIARVARVAHEQGSDAIKHSSETRRWIEYEMVRYEQKMRDVVADLDGLRNAMPKLIGPSTPSQTPAVPALPDPTPPSSTSWGTFVWDAILYLVLAVLGLMGVGGLAALGSFVYGIYYSVQKWEHENRTD